MKKRRIEYASIFKKLLNKLSRKHPDLQETIDRELGKIASARNPTGNKIPGLDGKPIFKVRIPLGNQGKRSGARIIYYCDDNLLLALYLYAKNEQSDVTIREVLAAFVEYDSEPDT